MRIRSAFFLTLLAFAGCGGGGTATNPDLGAPAPDLAGPPMCMPDGSKATFAARYGFLAQLNVNVRIPPDCEGDACILDTNAPSRFLFLADLQQNGQDLTMQARPCQFKIPEVKLRNADEPIVLTASDALVQSVAPAPTTAKLDGPNTCARFDLASFAMVIGARLADPSKDPLPAFVPNRNPPVRYCEAMQGLACDATMENGCICDQEKDTKPAGTVGAMGLPALSDVDQMYVALRTLVGMQATVFPAAQGQATPGVRLRGEVVGFVLDQSPVGCRHAPEGGVGAKDCTPSEAAAVAALNPKVTQAKGQTSPFTAVPIPANMSCADLAAQAGTLFKNF